MKSPLRVLFLFFLGIGSFILLSRQMPTNGETEYYPVVIKQVIETGEVTVLQTTSPYQQVKARIISGERKDTEFIINHGQSVTLTPEQLVEVGEEVIVSVTKDSAGKEVATIIDKHRLPGLIGLALLFFFIVILFAGKQGVGAIVGLMISALVILQFIVPQILNGADVVLISIIGAIFILVVTMYLAHGFTVHTTVAVVATAITLALSGMLSYLSVSGLQLFGMGSEEAYLLKFGALADLNLEGLLLAGMILGILGVLDDVTTSQTASVFALSQANQSLHVKDLIQRGLGIGREHIASLVNTLVLAYAGASFPIFIFFVLNPQQQPAWVIFNSEFMAEEIVRTLTGSMGLVLGVPIATIIAAFVVKRLKKQVILGIDHQH
jgi:uncharacterized membrane protein